MLLIVGLGNPGREPDGQRHNIGFVLVDELRRTWSLPEYRWMWHALWTRGDVAGKSVALLEPQTYMNLSGDAVQPAAAFLKVMPADVLVVHDELDLPFGDVRLKVGGGHAGHNGLRSIIERLGTPDFVRLRIGIGRRPVGAATAGEAPAREPRQPREETRSWVLSGFDSAQRAALPDIVARGADAVARVVTDGIGPAMNIVNTKR